MDKSKIINEIKRLFNKNGTPPGWSKFKQETGINKSEWFPELWFRWSDAIKEAGFAPNEFTKAHSKDFIIKRMIDLISELNHFPIDAELELKRKKDKSFPNASSIYKLGIKSERARAIINYLESNNIDSYDKIVVICQDIIDASPKREESVSDEKVNIGYVYLIKHGSRNEYKIGKTFNPLRREGEIRLELPEKIKPIHYIETDDPSGVEAYWHNRFKDKRKEGEWFSLLTNDIKAFKRWKKIL